MHRPVELVGQAHISKKGKACPLLDIKLKWFLPLAKGNGSDEFAIPLQAGLGFGLSICPSEVRTSEPNSKLRTRNQWPPAAPPVQAADAKGNCDEQALQASQRPRVRLSLRKLQLGQRSRFLGTVQSKSFYMFDGFQCRPWCGAHCPIKIFPYKKYHWWSC